MALDAFERRRCVPQHFLGRISSVIYDPGYRNHLALMADGYDVRVFLDGKPQHEFITADPDEGYVQCRAVLRSSAMTDTRRGSVSIRISRKPAARTP